MGHFLNRNEMKTFKQLLHERVSQDLFHATEFQRAVRIVQDDYFSLSEAWGDDKLHNAGFKYFLSTARSMDSDYIKYIAGEGHTVAFLLDGAKLAQNYRIDAVDYMGPGFKQQDRSEKEDRVLTNRSRIQVSKYCKEIYALIYSEYILGESEEAAFRHTAPSIAPTFIFHDEHDFLSRNKNRATQI